MRNGLGRVVVGLGCWFAWAAAGGAQEPESIRAFGDHLFRQGDYYRAITEYERFAFLSPEHPDVAEVRLRIGEAYYFGEKWDAAARMFRALETPETDRDVQRTAALYLAAVAMQQKDLQRASDLGTVPGGASGRPVARGRGRPIDPVGSAQRPGRLGRAAPGASA